MQIRRAPRRMSRKSLSFFGVFFPERERLMVKKKKKSLPRSCRRKKGQKIFVPVNFRKLVTGSQTGELLDILQVGNFPWERRETHWN